MNTDTIAAIATPAGTGGIAVIRISGPQAFEIADAIWRGRLLSRTASHTAHFGEITDAQGGTLDEALATVFHHGRSFTGEATVEFSIHGSTWLQREVLARIIEAGARMAEPGEFSQRAVINGRMDLAQAEGVADLIAASSRAAHRLATTQMKGVFSQRLDLLRQKMIDLASLLELELDFSEEDVEFADRSNLLSLCDSARTEIDRLASSFRTGQALKEGVPVAIAGAPNAGKSTLLNHLLQEEKAIVTDIPGTTRDIIEDTVEIDGILYRFIDTAGLRDTSDEVERIGIERAIRRCDDARIVLYLLDPTSPLSPQTARMHTLASALPTDTLLIPVTTKADLSPTPADAVSLGASPNDRMGEADGGLTDTGCKTGAAHHISARTGEGVDKLLAELRRFVTADHDPSSELIVTNLRHYHELRATSDALLRTSDALTAGLPADLVAQDLREAIHHLSLITGAITSDTLLHTIFSRFCIGK